MPYFPSVEHGIADYNSYVQVNPNITEAADIPDIGLKKFARMVYVVGSSSDPAAPVSSTISNSFPALAQEIVVNGTITYIAEAAPGSQLSAAVWRAKKITDNTSSISIKWADGNGNFDNTASDLSGLTYLP